jgi:phosphoglycerate dehydrogenase-like enzyme
MPVLYNDIVEIGLLDFVAAPVEKERLYREADVVSLHVPLTDLTQHMIDETALSHFKPGSVLINTSRGAVVDSDALAGALRAGTLGGAALDVVDPEPLHSDHPLMTAPNTVFTPHIGARTHRSLARMCAVVDDVIDVLQGKTPRFPAWT